MDHVAHCLWDQRAVMICNASLPWYASSFLMEVSSKFVGESCVFFLSLEHYPLPESVRIIADFFTQIAQGANAIFVSVVCFPVAAHAVDTDEDCSTLQTRSSSTLRTTLAETCEKIDGDSGVGWSIGTTTDIQGGNVQWPFGGVGK